MNMSVRVRGGPQTAPESMRPPPPDRRTSAGRCLLVSGRQDFLSGMNEAASAAGWDCAWCVRPEDSLRQAFLECYVLGIVDLHPASHRPLLKDLMRVLSTTSGGLTIAYDRLGDAEAELWARQNGAWLYVPGAADWKDLSLACQEAKRVLKRLESRGLLGAPA